jgi:electron transfer flavoprotein beta subunit
MPLRTLVCIKQVPDPEQFDRMTLDPATGSINRGDIAPVTNPVDRHALEEALRIREALGGSVSVLTMGPPQARKCLEDALAMGADRGVLLCDMAFAGADTLATAAVLAAGIRSAGDFDLVLCGNESADGATGQVPGQLAEALEWPRVTHARKIGFADGGRVALVEREIEGGFLRVEVRLPAVIAVVKRINRYRLPAIFGILEAGKKEIAEVGCAACECAGIRFEAMGLEGSPTRVAGIFQTHRKRHVEMIGGDPQEAARRLIGRLREMDAF